MMSGSILATSFSRARSASASDAPPISTCSFPMESEIEAMRSVNRGIRASFFVLTSRCRIPRSGSA